MDLINLLYLADIVSNLEGVTVALVMMLSIVLVVFSFLFFSEQDEASLEVNTYNAERVNKARLLAERYLKIIKRSFIALAISFAILVIAPSKKTMYIAIGLKAAGNIVDSELGKKAQEILLKKLDSYLEENSPKESK